MSVRSSAAVPWDRLLAFADQPRRLGPLFVVQAFFGGPMDLIMWLLAATCLALFSWAGAPVKAAAFVVASIAVFVAMEWPRKVKALSLARHGAVTTARLLSSGRGVTALGQPTITSVFAYDVGGVTFQLTVKGGDPTHILDDELEALFHDREDPERAALLDTIPGTPRLLPDGTFSAGKDAVLSLVPPLCFVGALVVFWLRVS